MNILDKIIRTRFKDGVGGECADSVTLSCNPIAPLILSDYSKAFLGNIPQDGELIKGHNFSRYITKQSNNSEYIKEVDDEKE